MNLRTHVASLFLGALTLLGCGSAVVTPTPDGGAPCRLSDGTTCALGATCPAPDGCNTCTCTASGAACTERACLDGGPAVDVVAPADVRRACRSTADCARGEECYIVEGCGPTSFCGPGLGRPCSGDIASYCGCDGVTFTGSSTCPPRVFARRGPCEAASACRLSDGRVCREGERCPAPDGCNTCTCNRGALSCTEIACPPGCLLSNGTRCRVGETCPAPDGCNVCVCRDGSPIATCTNRGCVDAGTPPPDVGSTCRSSADCPPSSMCQGAQGCDVPWRCVPATPCTADVAAFCGCDGRTFEGSSSCPGRPFRSRGACPASTDGGAACRPMDARGEGACDAYFGVAWTGTTCASISGCRCVGSDCGRLFRERAQCIAACGAD